MLKILTEKWNIFAKRIFVGFLQLSMKHFFLSICLLMGSVSLQAQYDPAQQINKMSSLLRLVSTNYVDTPGMESLVEDAIVGLLEELDPHSVYISKDELRKMNEPLEGEFEGIGISFNLFKDTILVLSAISGGPSERLGILAGDKIITIEGDTVAGVGFTNTNVQKSLRGKKGTKVNVGIQRSGVQGLISFDIVRDKIPIYSVDAGYMLNEEVGYIKVSRFAKKTVHEFRTEMDELQKAGMKSLVLDLRGNSGGYLSTAIDLADEFLPRNKLIVYTEGRNFPKDEKQSTSRGEFEKGKLVILIDAGSASASEIVSGAVQDWDRGLILGRRSFGKGLVQKPYMLPDQSAIRLTISRYYTPSGRSIQRPYGDGTEEYYQKLNERYESGEIYTADSIDFPDSLKFSTMNGRTVYGGGGIMPDIYVPVDTSDRTDYYVDLLRKGMFNKFSLNYLENGKRQEISSKYSNARSFLKDLDLVKLTNDFVDYANENGVEKNEEEINTSFKPISHLAAAYIARGVWDNSAFYEVYNEIDPVVDRAIETLEDKSFKKLKLSYR